MFYTEYRPQKFNELIGADHIVASITGALATESPAHAYFFTGSRGTGKTTTARLLAKALNCESPIVSSENSVKFEPCGKCQSCQAIKGGSHLDLIEIDAASNRGIDNIRELKEGVGLSPSMGKKKIYIIDEVHMLTTEASNALLKTLEEPPEHVYFILCTTNPEKVLDTIKSRCLQFQFKRPKIEDLVIKLNKIASDKNKKIEDSILSKIAVAAKGAYREAETLLEQFISGEKEIDELLAFSSTNYSEFINLISQSNRSKAIELIHKIYDSGSNIETWTENLIAHLRTLLLAKVGVKSADLDHLLTVDDKELINNLTPITFKKLLEEFSKAMREFKTAVIPTLPLELAIVDLTSTDSEKNETQKKDPITTKSKQAENKQETPEPQINKPKEVHENRLDIRIKKTTKTKTETKTDKPATEPKISNAKKQPEKSLEFSYKKLIDAVKPKNHAIHLLLHSCNFSNFDGKYLDLTAKYSFHKERLLSTKIREIIQDVASEIAGTTVVLRCDISKNPNAKKLTDKNIVSPDGKADLEEVFEKVFGEDLATESE